MARKKKACKKGKPLRQSWRDLVSWWTGQRKASAARAKQKVGDAKTRAKAAEDKAAAKAEQDKLKAENRAKRDAARAAERQAATERAQQRAAARGPVKVAGTIFSTGAMAGAQVVSGGQAVRCNHPHITNPREKCHNPVLPGSPTCAAGHPQGSSSFGGPPRSNWYDPPAAARPKVSPVTGRPLSDADHRFFDLRASGYTGPINQDGYASDRP